MVSIVLKVTVEDTEDIPVAKSLLTHREGEIIALIACGLMDKEIASQLGITWHTVRQHSYNIRQKLRARDRTHAVVIALKLGVIKLEELEIKEEPCEDDYRPVGSTGIIHRITRRSFSDG